MTRLDRRIRPLYLAGLGCRQIAKKLDENPVIIFKRIRKMNIARSSTEAASLRMPEVPAPFPSKRKPKYLRDAALGIAAGWFLRNGYPVSVPLSPLRYDLIVESGASFKKIQVKTTTNKRDGYWLVGISRRAYHKSGNRRVSYSSSDIDAFFIVCDDDSMYLIPIEATKNTQDLQLGKKYEKYRLAT